MMEEDELRDLHVRLLAVLTYAKSIHVPRRDLDDLLRLKIMIEWILQMNTASGRDWAAVVFKAIVNLEHLQRTAERSREARDN